MLLNGALVRELDDLCRIDRTILFMDEHDLIVHPHSDMFHVNCRHLEAGQRVLHSDRSRMEYFINVVRFRGDL